MYVGMIQIEDGHLEHIEAVSQALQVSELLKICQKHSDKNCVQGKTDATSALVDISTSVPQLIGVNEEDCKSSSSTQLHQLQPSSALAPESSRKAADSDVMDGISLSDDESEWGGVKCPKCDLVFMSLAKYQQHCSSHLGKTYTSCYVCNYASIRVPDVIKHLQEKDHGEKVCSICLLELSSSQSLKEHILTHDQAQPFLCLTCNTRFQTRTALNSHIVRHLNETPFVCKECGRGFKWKHGLRSHMVTHSKLKAFLCDQCGYSTAHLRSFIDHKTVHSGAKFKCPKPDCQFSSVRKESVKHHLKTHSKQRPFQCEICGQAFSQCKNLRRHAASHNPLADTEKCPFCSYQTNRSDKFKAHFKRYHKNGEKVESVKKEEKKRRKSPASDTTQDSVIETINSAIHLSTTKHSKFSDTDKNTAVSSQLNVSSNNVPNIESYQIIPFDKNSDNIVTKILPNVHIITKSGSPVQTDSEEIVSLPDPEFASSSQISLVNASFQPIEGLNTSASVSTKKGSSKLENNAYQNVSYAQTGMDITNTLKVFPALGQDLVDSSQMNDRSMVLPRQDGSDDTTGTECNTNSEKIIILDANKVLASPPDTVYVIPDGAYVIMDADIPGESTLELITEPLTVSSILDFSSAAPSLNNKK
ncbi:hypothetical protein ONE63_008904 [Megalurothrips usitatus]|uniref:C2H2-type domain-containing protein n=1 Tax=Megalurothrips usitatus TaxID=439358 RepID=A0AAV7XKM8_9NEOP|nr:hypothetical protein ONE63_008904 [Megalurothrips usitatus]